MKFKVTTYDKFTGVTQNQLIEADTEADAREQVTEQIVTIRPLHTIGEKAPKATKPVYVRTQTLRNRKEYDLCNKQMQLGRYSPEAVAKEQARLQAELDKELA